VNVIIITFESAQKWSNVIVNVLNFDFEALDIMGYLHSHVNQTSFRLLFLIEHLCKCFFLHVFNSEVVARKITPDHKLHTIRNGI